LKLLSLRNNNNKDRSCVFFWWNFKNWPLFLKLMRNIQLD